MAYRVQKHQINIQENINLGSEWPYSGRVTPSLPQTAPQPQDCQVSSTGARVSYRKMFQEAWGKTSYFVSQWSELGSSLMSQTGPGLTVTFSGSCKAAVLVQYKSQVSFLGSAFLCIFSPASSPTHISALDKRALPVHLPVLGNPLWIACCCPPPLTSVSEHLPLLCSQSYDYLYAHLFILQCFCAVCI